MPQQRGPDRGPRSRAGGKSSLTDAEIVNRVKNGKAGAMPAFKKTFKDEQLRAIVQYIRGLKEDGAAK